MEKMCYVGSPGFNSLQNLIVHIHGSKLRVFLTLSGDHGSKLCNFQPTFRHKSLQKGGTFPNRMRIKISNRIRFTVGIFIII